MADVAIIGLSGESIFLEVEEFHKPGETIKAKNVHIEPGGKGYNQAACLLKLGSSVAYLSAIASDKFGNECEVYLKQNNATLYFQRIDLEKTALATILTDKYGNNQVTVYPGASKHLNLNHLDGFVEEIKNAKFLLLTLEIPLPVLEKAIDIAIKNNVKIVLNPAPYHKDFNKLYMCDIITPNEIEAKQLFNLPLDSDIFAYIDYIKSNYLKDKLKAIIVTLGSNGVLLISKELIKHFPGIKVKAIDTTGAGDIFNATFVHFYKETNDLEKAIKYANLAAALSTTKKYVLNSLPDLNELLNIEEL